MILSFQAPPLCVADSFPKAFIVGPYIFSIELEIIHGDYVGPASDTDNKQPLLKGIDDNLLRGSAAFTAD
jgi:hypothetical protein